jgi:phosphoglycerol transferase MdoB-like AlkP superfamily enzyme
MYLLFWLFFFEIARIYFILFNLNDASGAGFWDICLSFIHGFKLDISMVAYVGFFAMPLFIVSAFFKSHKVLKISLDIFTGILLSVFSLIVISDAELYQHWGFRMDDTPLQYFSNPSLMQASTSNWRLVFLIFLYLDMAIGMFWIYYLTIGKRIKTVNPEKFWSLLYLLIAGSLIIPIRGGIGIVPINAGAVYFSNNMFLNHCAINVVWNSGTALFAVEIDYEKYEYFEKAELDTYFAKAHESYDSTINIIDGRPKKIVYVVLESFTANATGLGDSTFTLLTPNALKWKDQGILFSNFYANGDRSEKGIVSIFSSVPPMPSYSIMKDPKKSMKLPSVIRSLKDNGYKTAFYYGGDVNFSNMQSYLIQAGFDKIVSQNNLNIDGPLTKWGYHDEVMFDLFYDDIVNEKDSAVFALFTLSSHEPYDVPINGPYGQKTDSQKCQNAYYYTDSCLNDFLNKLKKSDDWDNTLVILVADHGTRFGNVEVWDLPKFKIYMLITGGALITEPFIFNQPADQSDISASLLEAMNIDHSEFIFSENMFAKYTPNAFYVFNHGYAFIKGPRWAIYDLNTDDFVYKGWDSEIIENQTKAYAQKLAEYYKSLEE